MKKYSEAVLASHLYLPKKELENIPAIRANFTAERKYEGEPVVMYKEVNGWFGIPLYHYARPENIAEKVLDKRVPGYPVKLEFRGRLWNTQLEVIQKFCSLLAQGGRTGFLLESPAGSGKTPMAIKMISILGVTTLVVVPRSNLIKQWVDMLQEFLGLERKFIGVAEGGKCSYEDKTVVVGLVHTLALDRFGSAFKKYFGCVVFDEVDRSVPPTTFAPVVQMFPSKYRIGMSATVKRQDGLEVVFEKHVGQCYLKGKGHASLKAKVLVHTFAGHSGNVFPGSKKLNRRGMLISKLANNAARNHLIARYAAMIHKSGRQCVVLSDRTRQLLFLKDVLVKRFKVGRPDIGFYVRSLPILGKRTKSGKPAVRALKPMERVAASACKIILATYGMFAVGTDIPTLDGLVYATPQSETGQSKGRLDRITAEKKEPVIVDIVDTQYRDAVRWALARERQYIRAGLEIRRVK